MSYSLFNITEYDRYCHINFKIVRKLLYIAPNRGKADFWILVTRAQFLFSLHFLPVISRTLNKSTFVSKNVVSLFRLFIEEGVRREQKGTLLCILLRQTQANELQLQTWDNSALDLAIYCTTEQLIKKTIQWEYVMRQ